MFEIILHEPEIPPNTGNIIRLCANTGCRLHLIEPLGFTLDDARLRRAGLDYHEYAGVRVHADLDACMGSLGASWPLPEVGRGAAAQANAGAEQPRRVFAFTTRGTQRFDQIHWQPGDAMVFGPETRGLSADLLAQFDATRTVRLPMQPHSRSLNLSNAVAVAVFEAWRQLDFSGGR